MMTTLERVFVYGTLKKGEYNHHFLRGCRGQPALAFNIALHAGKFYPFVVRGRGNAYGEVYQVNPTVMRRLDGLEAEYRRELTPVRLANGKTVEAWIYLSELAYRYPRLARGVWRKR